jgi:HEPN domain-containing protein
MNDNKQQTAVEWLASELSNHLEMPHKYFIEILEQAKEMEKEQIKDAYWDGGQDVPLHINTCEQWYKQTYGGNK